MSSYDEKRLIGIRLVLEAQWVVESFVGAKYGALCLTHAGTE
jgi:hypothetical protein